MLAYHGTDKRFEKFDFNKSTEIGFCFAAEVSVARAYGEIIYTVELNPEKILNITDKTGAAEMCELCEQLKIAVEEEGDDEITEIINEDFGVFIDVVQEAGLMIDDHDDFDLENPENFVRWHMLNAAKNVGYDCVLIEDYTNGDVHETYIILNDDVITKLTDH